MNPNSIDYGLNQHSRWFGISEKSQKGVIQEKINGKMRMLLKRKLLIIIFLLTTIILEMTLKKNNNKLHLTFSIQDSFNVHAK